LIPGSGTAGNPITFGAYGLGAKPVFDGTGVVLPTNHGLIRGSTKNYITIEDIRVQNVGIGDANENTGIGFYGSTNLIVQHCEVYRTESAGIKMNTGSNVSVLYNDVTMTNCADASEQISFSAINGFEIAHNNSHINCNPSYVPSGGAGIDTKDGSKNGTIHHNHVWNLTSNGIYVGEWAGVSNNIRVYNNYVHDIVDAVGIMTGAEAGGEVYDLIIHHNIIANADGGGINFHNQGTTGSPIHDIHIYNNTFYQNGTNGATYLGGARILDQLLATNGVTFKNNIFSNAYNWQIGYNPTYVQPEDIFMDYNVIYGAHTSSGGYIAISGTNAIFSDPLYISARKGDFTLQAGSPAIGSGDNSVWIGKPNITDFNGTAITDSSGNIVAPGGTVSCGAYEYNEGATGFNDIDDDGFGKDNDGILIYPNPARDYLIIKNSSSKQFKLSLINILNETIISNKIISRGDNGLSIDNLSNGIYFVKIYNDLDCTSTTVKIIKNG
jgi:hypothetical protein